MAARAGRLTPTPPPGGSRAASGRATSARTNTYDNLGILSAVHYSDATPSLAFAYDRQGWPSQVQVGSTATTSLSFNDVGQLLGESYAGGPLDGLGVTSGYDALLRRTSLALSGPFSAPALAYTYTNDSRLGTVCDANGNSATYSYLANSTAGRPDCPGHQRRQRR